MATTFTDPSEYADSQRNSDANLPQRIGGLNRILTDNYSSFTEEHKGKLAGSIDDQKDLFNGVVQFGIGAEEQQEKVRNDWLLETANQLAFDQDSSPQTVAERLSLALKGDQNVMLSEPEAAKLEEWKAGITESQKFQNPAKLNNGRPAVYPVNDQNGNTFGEGATINFDGGVYSRVQFDTNEKGQPLTDGEAPPWYLVKHQRTWAQTNKMLEEQIGKAQQDYDIAKKLADGAEQNQFATESSGLAATVARKREQEAKAQLDTLKAKHDSLTSGSQGQVQHLQGEITDFIKGDETLLNHVPRGEGVFKSAYYDIMGGYGAAEANTLAGLRYMAGDVEGAKRTAAAAKEAEQGRSAMGFGRTAFQDTNTGAIMRELGPELVQTMSDMAIGAGVMRLVDGGLSQAAKIAGRGVTAATGETVMQQAMTRSAKQLAIESFKEKLHSRFGRYAEAIVDAGPGAMEEASSVVDSLNQADQYNRDAQLMEMKAKTMELGDRDALLKEAADLREKGKVIEDNAALAFYTKAGITLATDAMGFERILNRGPLDDSLSLKAARGIARKQAPGVTGEALEALASKVQEETATRVRNHLEKIGIGGKVKEMLKTGNFEGVMEVVQGGLNTAATNAFLNENQDLFGSGSIREYGVGLLVGTMVKGATVNMSVGEQKKLVADILDRKKAADQTSSQAGDAIQRAVQVQAQEMEGFGKVQGAKDVVKQDAETGKWKIEDNRDVASVKSPTGIFGHLRFDSQEAAEEFAKDRWQTAFGNAFEEDIRNRIQSGDAELSEHFDRNTWARMGDNEKNALLGSLDALFESVSSKTGVDKQTTYAAFLLSQEGHDAVDLGDYAEHKVINQESEPDPQNKTIWHRPSDGKRFVNEKNLGWVEMPFSKIYGATKDDYKYAAEYLINESEGNAMANFTKDGRERVVKALKQFRAGEMNDMPVDPAASILLKNTAKTIALQRKNKGDAHAAVLYQGAPENVDTQESWMDKVPQHKESTVPPNYEPDSVDAAKVNVSQANQSAFDVPFKVSASQNTKDHVGVKVSRDADGKPTSAITHVNPKGLFQSYNEALQAGKMPDWIRSPYAFAQAKVMYKKAEEFYRSQGMSDEQIGSPEMQNKISTAIMDEINSTVKDGKVEEVRLQSGTRDSTSLYLTDDAGNRIVGSMSSRIMPMYFSYQKNITEANGQERAVDVSTYDMIKSGKRRSTTRFMSAADSPAPGSLIFIRDPKDPQQGMFALVNQNYTLGQRLESLKKYYAERFEGENKGNLHEFSINKLAEELTATEGYPPNVAREKILGTGKEWGKMRHVKFTPVTADYARLRMLMAGDEVRSRVESIMNGARNLQAEEAPTTATMLGSAISKRKVDGLASSPNFGVISGEKILDLIKEDLNESTAATYNKMAGSLMALVNLSGKQILDGLEVPATATRGEAIGLAYKHIMSNVAGAYEIRSIAAHTPAAVALDIFPGSSPEAIAQALNLIAASLPTPSGDAMIVPGGMSEFGMEAAEAIRNGNFKMVALSHGDTVQMDQHGNKIQIINDGKIVTNSTFAPNATGMMIYVNPVTGGKQYYLSKTLTQGQWTGEKRWRKMSEGGADQFTRLESYKQPTPAKAIGLMFLRASHALKQQGAAAPWGDASIATFTRWLSTEGSMDQLAKLLPNWRDFQNGWMENLEGVGGDASRLMEGVMRYYAYQRDENTRRNNGRIPGTTPLSSHRDQRLPDDQGREKLENEDHWAAAGMRDFLSGGLGDLSAAGPQAPLTEEEATNFSESFSGAPMEGTRQALNEGSIAPSYNEEVSDALVAAAADDMNPTLDVNPEDVALLGKGTDNQRDDAMVRILSTFGVGGSDESHQKKTDILNGLKEKSEAHKQAIDAIDAALAAPAPQSQDPEAAKQNAAKRQQLEQQKFDAISALEKDVLEAEQEITKLQLEKAQQVLESTKKDGKVDPDYREANAAARKRIEDIKAKSAERTNNRPDLATRYKELTAELKNKQDPTKIEGSKDEGYGNTALAMLRSAAANQMNEQIEALEDDLRLSLDDIVNDDTFDREAVSAILDELSNKPELIEQYNNTLAEIQDFIIANGRTTYRLASELNQVQREMDVPNLPATALEAGTKRIRELQDQIEAERSKNKEKLAPAKDMLKQLSELHQKIEDLDLMLKAPDVVSLYSNKSDAERVARGIVGTLWYKGKVRPLLDHGFDLRSGFNQGLPANYSTMVDKFIADAGTMLGIGRAKTEKLIEKWEKQSGVKMVGVGENKVEAVSYRNAAMEMDEDEIRSNPEALLQFIWLMDKGRWAASEKIGDISLGSFADIKEKSKRLDTNRLLEAALMPDGWTRPVRDSKGIDPEDEDESKRPILERDRIAPEVLTTANGVLERQAPSRTWNGGTRQQFDRFGQPVDDTKDTGNRPMGFDNADGLITATEEAKANITESIKGQLGNSSQPVATRLQRLIESVTSLKNGSIDSLRNEPMEGVHVSQNILGLNRMVASAIKDLTEFRDDKTATDAIAMLRPYSSMGFSIIEHGRFYAEQAKGGRDGTQGNPNGQVVYGLAENVMGLEVNGVPVADLIKVADASSEGLDANQQREARKQLWKSIFSSSDLLMKQWELISKDIRKSSWRGIIATNNPKASQSHEQAFVDLWTEGFEPVMQPAISHLYSDTGVRKQGKTQGLVRGAIELRPNAVTNLPTIRLVKGKATSSTFIHETVHWLRVMKLPNGQDLFSAALGEQGAKDLMAWASENGKIDPNSDFYKGPGGKERAFRAVEENIALGVEKYFALGSGRIYSHFGAAAQPMATLANYIRRTWLYVWKNMGNTTLPPEVIKSFDDLFMGNLAPEMRRDPDTGKPIVMDMSDPSSVSGYMQSINLGVTGDAQSNIFNVVMQTAIREGSLAQATPIGMTLPIDPATGSGTTPDDYQTVVVGTDGTKMLTEQDDLEAMVPEEMKDQTPVIMNAGDDTALNSYTPIATAPQAPPPQNANRFDDGIKARFLRAVYYIGTKLRFNGKAPKILAQQVIDGKNMRATVETILARILGDYKRAIDASVTDMAGGLNLSRQNDIRSQLNKHANDWLSSPDATVRSHAWAYLPPAMRAALTEARSTISGLSDALIAKGIAYGPMVNTINANRAHYLHRTFNFPSDLITPEQRVEWSRSPSNAHVWTRTVQQLIARGIVNTAQEAELMIENTIQSVSGYESEVGGKNIFTSPGGLTQRQLTHDEATIMGELLGLETSAEKNFANTIHAMMHTIMDHDIQANIRDIGLKEGWIAKKTDMVPGLSAPFHPKRYNEALGYNPVDETMVTSTTAASLGPLYGYSSTPEIAEWFAEMSRNELEFAKAHKMIALGYKINGMWKMLNTVYNPVTALKNVYGAFLSYVSTGHFFGGLGRAAKIVMAQEWGHTKTVQRMFGPAEISRLQRVYEMLIARGAAESGSFNDLLDLMNHTPDFRNLAIGGIIASPKTGDKAFNEGVYKLRSGLGTVRKGFTKFYMYGDAYFKMAAFFAESDNLARLFPNKSQGEIDSMAAGRIADTMFSFEREPYWLRNWKRNFPLAGVFFGFGYGMLRAGMNNMAIGFTDVRDGFRRVNAGDPTGKAQVTYGIRRLASLGAVAGGVNVMANYISSALFGWDDEKQRAAKNLMPDFDRDGMIVFISKYKPGEKGLYFNLSNLMPYSYGVDGAVKLAKLIPSIINDLQNGNEMNANKKFDDYFTDAVLHWASPWVDPTPLVKLTNLLINRRNEKGEEIYGSDATNFYEKSNAMVREIARLFAPGAVKAAANNQMLPIETQRYLLGRLGKPIPTTHKIAYAMGFRIGVFNPELGLKSELEKSIGIYNDARSRFTGDMITRAEKLGLDDLRKRSDRFQESAAKAIIKAGGNIDDALKLGMNPITIMSTFRDARPGTNHMGNISKEMMFDVIRTEIGRPMKISHETLINIQKGAIEAGDERRLENIAQLVREGRIYVTKGR